MALIENANPKGNIKDSGYYRTIGDEWLARLMQLIQSTVITNGTELEHFHEAFCPYPVYKTEWTYTSPKTGRVIKSRFKVPNTTPTLSDVFEKYNNGENCFFPKIKISKEELMNYGVDLKSKKNIELDGVLIIDGTITIAEIKDGSDFDTKKSDGEIKMFKLLEKVFQDVLCQYKLVLWNLKDINDNSVKSLEASKYITNGKTFSEEIGLPFDKINSMRNKDCPKNEKWVIEEMRKIVKEYDETNN